MWCERAPLPHSGGLVDVGALSRGLLRGLFRWAGTWLQSGVVGGNTNTTIKWQDKWQDGACYRIESRFMIFDLRLVLMCAVSHRVHGRTAASPMGHPQDGDKDGHLSPSLPMRGKGAGGVFLCRC